MANLFSHSAKQILLFVSERVKLYGTFLSHIFSVCRTFAGLSLFCGTKYTIIYKLCVCYLIPAHVSAHSHIHVDRYIFIGSYIF